LKKNKNWDSHSWPEMNMQNLLLL